MADQRPSSAAICQECGAEVEARSLRFGICTLCRLDMHHEVDAACPYCGSVACGCTAPARLADAEAALRAAREDCHPSVELYFKRFPEADT